MTTQFLQENLWPEITSRVRKARRNFVAVAYLGKNAKRQLPLHRNDVLVVDMSLAAVKSGQTNPEEIEKLHKAGVIIHSCTNLHAKVFVMDRVAIIGSGNASRHSKNTLVEAALLTNDKGSVDSARAFVQSCMGELITPQYLKECKGLYKPPKVPRTGRSKQADRPRLWVQYISNIKEVDPNRDRSEKIGKRVAQKLMHHKRKFIVEELPYPVMSKVAKNASFGDLIIQVWKKDENTPLRVYPPSRVLYTRNYTSRRGARKRHFFLESPENPDYIEWQVFKKKMRAFGWRRFGKYVDREVASAEMIRNVLSLWESWEASK